MSDALKSAAVRQRRLMASPAFREASLRSEIGRSYAVISILGLVIVVVIARELAGGIDQRIPLIAMGAVGVLLGIQLSVLLLVRRARQRGRGIPLWFSA